MTRVNIYLPPDLAERARVAEINVSAVAQEALDDVLQRLSLSSWLAEVRDLPALRGPSESAPAEPT